MTRDRTWRHTPRSRLTPAHRVCRDRRRWPHGHGAGRRRSPPRHRGRRTAAAAAQPSRPAADAVLLCVPDVADRAAAAARHRARPGSSATARAPRTLAPLAPHEAFSLHPLMTVTPAGATFSGATAAIAGATPRALLAAEALARALGMRPVHVADADRAAYHAAASIASNFLVTLEGFAERLADTAGIDREPLVALVRGERRQLGRAGAAERADRPDRPRRRGDRRPPARRRRRAPSRRPRRSSTRSPRHPPPRRRAGDRFRHRMKTLRTVAELRAALRRPAPRRAQHRPRPDDGRPARGPPLAHPPRPRRAATRSS